MAHPSLLIWILVTLSNLLWLYTIVVVIAVVMSWLVAFGIINTFNPAARAIVRFLDAMTEPVFRQIRKVVPPVGGLDLSPLILILFLDLLMQWAIPYLESWIINPGV